MHQVYTVMLTHRFDVNISGKHHHLWKTSSSLQALRLTCNLGMQCAQGSLYLNSHSDNFQQLCRQKFIALLLLQVNVLRLRGSADKKSLGTPGVSS